jgi:uncharacterized protein
LKSPIIDLDTKIQFLSRASSYPEQTTKVDVIKTHMSCVFLTDNFVYKLKKPIQLSFLDFRSLDAREHYCQESLHLNRRLAKEVYLGVIALTVDAVGRLHIGGDEKPVEWLEKMQRLPNDLMLDNAIREGSVSTDDVHHFMASLIEFYRCAKPVAITKHAYRQRFMDNINADFSVLQDRIYGLPQQQLKRLGTALLDFVRVQAQLFDARVEAQHIIEAHGDLRPEHVCLLPRPVFIDCLEFDRELRIMDSVDELAFLAMECERAGAGFIGEQMFELYLAGTDDTPPQSLIDFYKAHHAIVRAKLSAWHILDYPPEEHPKWIQQAKNYLDLAERYTSIPTA